jgi:hypothetical protein
MGYTEARGFPPGGGSSGGPDLAYSDRDRRNRFGAIVMRAILSVAALVVLVLGPFVVQCRTPNGTVAAKLLFVECPPDAGCCSLPWEITGPRTVNSETDSRVMDYDGSPCGGCSENALFSFVGSRSSRDDGKLVGSIPYVLAEVHPASKLTATMAKERLAETTFFEAPLSPGGIYRVLRI